MEGICAGEKNWRRRYRAPNLDEADLMRGDVKFLIQILS